MSGVSGEKSEQFLFATAGVQTTPLISVANAPTVYANHLGLSDDAAELSRQLGDLTLDLGSGHEYLAQALSSEAPGTRVVSLNPKLYDEAFRGSIQERNWTSASRLSVAGLAQALPFRSNRFSSAVSLFAFPTVFDETTRVDEVLTTPIEEYQRSYEELVRVLRPGGTAYLGPVWYEAKNMDALSHIPGIDARIVDPPAGTLSALHIIKL